MQVSTQLMSIRAVLQGLQAMITVPLAEELVLKGPPQPADHLPAAVVAEVGACSHLQPVCMHACRLL